MNERRAGYIYVVMSRPPGPHSEFVELEDDQGKGVGGHRWIQEGNYWLLELPGILPSEALFGFMGWLTTRDEEAGPFSGEGTNNSQAADLVGAYCEEQGWADPRDHWEDRLKPGPKA